MTTMQQIAIVDAERAMHAYAPGGTSDLEKLRSNITCLIADIMHLCDNHGLSFDSALDIARAMHDEDCKPPNKESGA